MIPLAHNIPPQEWRTATFSVDVKAIGKGSMRAIRRKDGGVFMKESGGEKLVLFMSAIKLAARAVWRGEPSAGPVMLEVIFTRVCPKKPKYRWLPITKPDGDKTLRAVKDSLTGIVYLDDAQVTDSIARKRFADHDGAQITVSWLEPKTLFLTEHSSNGTKSKRRRAVRLD